MPHPEQYGYGQFAVPDTIIKIRPYLYTYGDIANPTTKVVVKVDLWITDGLPSRDSMKYQGKKVTTKYISKCICNLHDGTIIRANGAGVTAYNISAVIDLLRRIIEDENVKQEVK